MWNISKITLGLLFSFSFYELGFSQNIINGTPNSETIIGTPSDDIIYAGGGTIGDEVYGRDGNDRLYGQNGPDFLFGEEGKDSYFGGDGVDTVTLLDLHRNTEGIIVNLETGLIENDGFGNTEQASSIEIIDGATAYPDHITGDNSDNLLDAAGAGDTVIGLGGDDTIQGDAAGTYDGSDGFDKLVLTLNSYFEPDNDSDGFWDVIETSSNEIVDINLESGLILNDGYGNSGEIQNIEDIEVIAPGLDFYLTVNPTNKVFTVRDARTSYISGSNAADEVRAFADINLVYAGDGNDKISGGDGDDQIYGGNGGDVLYGNGGNDKIFGEGNSDTLYGGDGNDIIYGGGAGDYVHGEEGDDILNGNSGNDWMRGDLGNDIIYGGKGRDTLSGHSGNDIFFTDEDDIFINGGAGYDKVVASNYSGPINLDMSGGRSIEQAWGTPHDDRFDGTGAFFFLKFLVKPEMMKLSAALETIAYMERKAVTCSPGLTARTDFTSVRIPATTRSQILALVLTVFF